MSLMVYDLGSLEGLGCYINGKNSLSAFYSVLKELTPVAGKISSSIVKAMSASHLRSSGYEMEIGKVKAIFYVYGETKEICYINTNQLLLECKTCVIQTDEDGFEYAAIMSEASSKETGIDFYNQVEITFAAIKRKPLVSQDLVFNLDGVALFHNSGVSRSGLRLIITPRVDLDNLIVDGITIKNLQKDQSFVLDGLEGKVLCNGVNRFLDTDLVEFPKVYPGRNQVTLFPADVSKVDIRIEYYPTFIV